MESLWHDLQRRRRRGRRGQGEVLSVNPVGEPGDDSTRSSIAIAGGQIFRKNGKLFCVGKTQVAVK